MKRVTFYENNELNRNWNSLFEDIFECNNLIKIENVHLDLCCKVRLLWIALMILNHRFIQEKKNWSWRYILKPKQEVFVSDAENCYQFFLSNVIFLLHLKVLLSSIHIYNYLQFLPFSSVQAALNSTSVILKRKIMHCIHLLLLQLYLLNIICAL